MIHIVTPFPDLLIYSFFVPTFLRLIVGIFTLSLTVSKAEKETPSAIMPDTVNIGSKKNFGFLIRALIVISSLFMIIGLYTQIAALVLIILFIISFFKPGRIFPQEIPHSVLILLLTITISLLFTGAGAFAIDYPL